MVSVFNNFSFQIIFESIFMFLIFGVMIIIVIIVRNFIFVMILSIVIFIFRFINYVDGVSIWLQFNGDRVSVFSRGKVGLRGDIINGVNVDDNIIIGVRLSEFC